MAYENGLRPQPAIAVNILGAKSLQGLMAYAQLRPKDIPMATTLSPILMTAIPGLGFMFRLSVIARIQIRRRAVPRI